MYSMAEMIEGSKASHAQAYVAIHPEAAAWTPEKLQSKMSAV
jgi:hypothetical protein